jgi:hypothetical protein
MTIKEDLKRVSEYGKDPYYKAIRAVPSYQNELNRTRTDFNERSWIQSPFKLPRFTDAEFEKKRITYQAKYGSTMNVPGFNDVFHLKIPVTITTEEMAAHRFAKKRGLPSPLTPEKLEAIAGRRYRFLKALASPAPGWLKNASAVLTFLDNSEDALVTAAVLGRLAVKYGPRIFSKLTGPTGWLLLGSDILNFFNISSQISFAAMGHKRIIEDYTNKLPFSAKAKAARTSKLSKLWPTFGEILEIAQTTDQMFGFGICLGQIMGMVQEVMLAEASQLEYMGVKIVETIKQPTQWEKIWARALTSPTIIWSGGNLYLKDDREKVTATSDTSIHALWPWWSKENPLEKIKGLANWLIKPPKASRAETIETLAETGYDPTVTPNWPMMDVPAATLEDIVRTFAPKIKDEFQDYALRHRTDWNAYICACKATEYTQGITAALSDDGTAVVSQTAYAQAAKEMSRDILLMPPDTPQGLVDQLAEWIENYERRTAGSPSTKEIEMAGRLLGIQWTRSFPRITFGKAAELYPEWRAIQEQLQQLNIAD